MTTQEKIFQLLGSIDERLNSGDEKFRELKLTVDAVHNAVCHDLTLRVTEIETAQENHLTAHSLWFSRGWKALGTIIVMIGGYFKWMSRG